MPNSAVWLRSIVALVGAMIVAIPLSAQARCANGMNCKHPVASTSMSTVYRYNTVPEVSNVNRYRNVTRKCENPSTHFDVIGNGHIVTIRAFGKFDIRWINIKNRLRTVVIHEAASPI